MKPDADSEVVGRDVEVVAGLIVVVIEDSALPLIDIRSSYFGITSTVVGFEENLFIGPRFQVLLRYVIMSQIQFPASCRVTLLRVIPHSADLLRLSGS